MTLQAKQVDNRAASDVLAFLAQMREQLAAFRQLLLTSKARGTISILNVVSDIECHRYESGLTVEMWVEADLDSGDSLTWWLDIVSREDGWLLDGRISWNGQDAVFEQQPLVVSDFPTAQHKASSMLEELFHAGSQVLNKRLTA